MDVPALSATVSSLSNALLGVGAWAPVGGAEERYPIASRFSRMIRTTNNFYPPVDTTHIDAGAQLEQRNDRRNGNIQWHTYPWNVTDRQSYAADVLWAASTGTPNRHGDIVARTLPVYSRSPRLGLTFLTSFTNCSHREGPTVLVPQSHLELLKRMQSMGDPWLNEVDANGIARDIRASTSARYEFTATMGDIVVMHPLLVHARNGFLPDPLDTQQGNPGRFRVLAQTAVFLKHSTDLRTIGDWQSQKAHT